MHRLFEFMNLACCMLTVCALGRTYKMYPDPEVGRRRRIILEQGPRYHCMLRSQLLNL